MKKTDIHCNPELACKRVTMFLFFCMISLDLHLIFNLVSASTSFQTAESWTPICLPRFDNRWGLSIIARTYFEYSVPEIVFYVSAFQQGCNQVAWRISTDMSPVSSSLPLHSKAKQWSWLGLEPGPVMQRKTCLPPPSPPGVSS